MTTQNPFKLIQDSCEKTGADLVLIGSHALGAHGYHRMTLDIDFMTTEKDYNKIKETMGAVGYGEVARTEVAAKLRGTSEDLIDIDFLFVDENTFEGVKADAKTSRFGACELLVAKPEHLIALKLHAIKQQPKARELKDLSDIVELVNANQIDVTTTEFKSMCLKYGPEELYSKILKHVAIND